MTPSSEQNGRQAKNRKKGGMNFKNLLLWNHWAILNYTWQQLSLDGPLSELCPMTWSVIKDDRQAKNRKKGGDEIWKIFSSESIEWIFIKLG